jgi:lysine-specific demethylase 8
MTMLGQIERVSWLSLGAFRDRYLSRSPVVITDVMSGWKAMDWTIEELRDRFESAKMPLRMNDDEFEAFCEATNDQLLRNSKELRAPEHKENFFWTIRLSAYFDAVLRGGDLAKRLPYIMDVPLSRSIITRYLQILRIDTAENWNPLITALESLITEVAFPEYLAGDRDYRFWFAPGPRHQGVIHADGYHNFNAQIRGRKEWILLPPDQSIQSGVKYMELVRLKSFSCITSKGEILYIPKLWWHAATALETCININAWHVGPIPTVVSPAAI